MLNVLQAFSNYDREIRYVQGMNFMVGFFLFHCEQHVAFWLFVSLIEEYGLREIFIEGLPGLKVHSANVLKILKSNYNEELEVLEKLNVNVEICMVEWVFSLFSSLMPLEIQLDFYEGFFLDGWNFFYKVCVCVIDSIDLKSKIYLDCADVYIALKLGKHSEESKNTVKKWRDIVNKSFNIEFNV